VLQCRPLTPKWGVIEAQAGGFRNEDRLLGIGVTAAAHGRPDRVHAAKAPQIRCGASRRFRPREPRTERRPEGFVPRTCRLLHRRVGGGDDLPPYYARHEAGLPLFRSPLRLTRAARAKDADVVRCGFSHTACGHAFEHRINQAGYRWTRVGENLAFGSGSLGRPYTIFSSWMRSPEHRVNILSPGFRDLGIAVRLGSFSGYSNASVWVAEFGSH